MQVKRRWRPGRAWCGVAWWCLQKEDMYIEYIKVFLYLTCFARREAPGRCGGRDRGDWFHCSSMSPHTINTTTSNMPFCPSHQYSNHTSPQVCLSSQYPLSIVINIMKCSVCPSKSVVIQYVRDLMVLSSFPISRQTRLGAYDAFIWPSEASASSHDSQLWPLWWFACRYPIPNPSGSWRSSALLLL